MTPRAQAHKLAWSDRAGSALVLILFFIIGIVVMPKELPEGKLQYGGVQ